MPTKDQFTELAVALAWTPIESKNPYMISFVRNSERLNYYFTTGTVTVQSSEGVSRNHKEVTIDTLEPLIA